ncbi:MAG: Crp/Fnr family transcriptional regulator [Proteobacteria bacterium]|nr:Crp/Fnr family transcriptional regulator [Pseudomonadota bacterium]MBI3507975.1 Crp/Fnr family transcriptional regulator [Pseudomonadota bacterium]
MLSDDRLFVRDVLLASCAECGVRDLAVCASVGDADLRRFAELMSEVVLAPGASLFTDGAPAYHVFTVTAGVLKITKRLPSGKSQIAGFLSIGDYLGLAHGKTYTCGALAVTAVRLCRFPRDRLLRLLAELPPLEHCLRARASNEHAAAHALLLARKTPVERLAAFLLAEAHRGERRSRPAPVIELAMSRADLADHLGLTGEAVNEAFARLKRDRLVSLSDPAHVRLDRPEALAGLIADA